MTQSSKSIDLPPPFPDHTQLPESDGTFVTNFQEHPQSIILTDSLEPILERLYPDGQYAIGQDCGIYWRETDPPEKGAEAPNWFFVPGVPPTLDGQIRRSYVLWREYRTPLIALEFASGDGEEERDKTPLSATNLRENIRPGKFWVYEQIMRISFYGIYEIKNERLEVYHFIDGGYQLLEPNERGHYPIFPLEIELGLWHGGYQLLEPNERGHYPIFPLEIELGLWRGNYQNLTQTWLRWWDNQGNLLLTGSERAILEKERAEQAELALVQERFLREQQEQKLQAMAERLRELGIEPDSI